MTYEPHKVSKPENAWQAMWRRLVTGVRDEDWRRICDRCGYTGQTHGRGFIKCWRFKPKKEVVQLRKSL